jgi:predicted membrane channel-forming protein YqfA (hemolysin III family)
MIKEFINPTCDTPYFFQTKEDVVKCSFQKGLFVAILLFILTLIILYTQRNKLNTRIVTTTFIFSLILTFIIVYLYKILNLAKWESVQYMKERIDKDEYKECDKLRILAKSKPQELDILFYFFFGVYILGWIILIFGIKIDVQTILTKNLMKFN